MKDKIVNIAVQVLPTAKDKHPYAIVDEAIAEIAASGLNYKVTPFETVIEGPYEEVMRLVEKVQDACYKAGADSLMCYIKIQSRAEGNVTISDKMEKYDS